MQKGRGAISNRTGRFEALAVEAVDDGWGIADEPLPPLQTTVQPEPPHSVITKNNSPDIPFDQSINPYRGCEHGCVYCVSGDTPILMGDGSLKPLAELSVGDEIYGTVKSGHLPPLRSHASPRPLADEQAGLSHSACRRYRARRERRSPFPHRARVEIRDERRRLRPAPAPDAQQHADGLRRGSIICISRAFAATTDSGYLCGRHQG